MDGWSSVIPEKIAEHIALRTKELSISGENIGVLDAFVGMGGNLI